jgi:hypothetical protein
VDMLYIEFGRNRFVGLAAIGKKHTGNGRRTDGRTDARTQARTQTKIIVPRFRSGTKKGGVGWGGGAGWGMSH